MRDILFLLCVMLTVCAGVFFLLKLIAADIRTAKETFRKFPEWTLRSWRENLQNGTKNSVMLNLSRANRCFVRTSESWYMHETSKTKTVLQVWQLLGGNAVSRAMVL